MNVLFVGLLQNSTQGPNAESQLKLVFKAQSQCARTAQILGELKKPTPIVRQTNIGQNVQVNKGVTQKKEKPIQPTKLMTETHGTTLDSLGAGPASRVDTTMATVAQFHRTKKRGRQG